MTASRPRPAPDRSPTARPPDSPRLRRSTPRRPASSLPAPRPREPTRSASPAVRRTVHQPRNACLFRTTQAGTPALDTATAPVRETDAVAMPGYGSTIKRRADLPEPRLYSPNLSMVNVFI
jgi:hypothetical protein